jgi:hypothetical protein
MAEPTTTTTPTEPQPGTDEYNAMMAARYREMQGRTEPPARPEHVPEKFWNAEKGEVNVDALLKSYGELEKTRSTTTQPTTDPAKDPAAPPKIPENADEAAKKAVENAGLDWGKLETKIAETGTIEESEVEALVKGGIPKSIIDNYLELAKAASVRQTELAHAHVGSEEKMNELLGWAANNLSAAEIATYNKMLATRDGWKPALDIISNKMASASKTSGEPTLQNGTGGARGNEGYRSRADMMKDMSSPEYQTNPTFRQQVAQKMSVSTFDLDNRRSTF